MSLPTTQKAAFVNPREPVFVKERPVPTPEKDELLVKITATAINPVDWKIRDYGVFLSEWPGILGSDAAGVVAAVGAEVTNFKVGDRVFFQGIIGDFDSSTFQQYAKIPADVAGHTPSSVSDEEAAGVTLAAIAGVAGLYHVVALSPPWKDASAGKGKSVIVLGGSSSVGQYGIQLARLSGFSSIVSASSAGHLGLLKELGATAALDRNGATAADYVNALGDVPLTAIYDSISSPETLTLAVEIVKLAAQKGVIDTSKETIQIISVSHQIQEAKDTIGSTPASIHPVFGKGVLPHLRPLASGFMQALGGEEGWLAKGLYKPNKPFIVSGGLNGLEEALQKNKKGVSGLKVVIKPDETS